MPASHASAVVGTMKASTTPGITARWAAIPRSGSNRSNCHKQCVPCNQHKSGDIVNYRISLVLRISQDKLTGWKGPRTTALHHRRFEGHPGRLQSPIETAQRGRSMKLISARQAWHDALHENRSSVMAVAAEQARLGRKSGGGDEKVIVMLENENGKEVLESTRCAVKASRNSRWQPANRVTLRTYAGRGPGYAGH